MYEILVKVDNDTLLHVFTDEGFDTILRVIENNLAVYDSKEELAEANKE